MNTDAVGNDATAETKAEKEQSVKEEIMENGKPSVWEIIFAVRCFLPLLASIGLAIGLTIKPQGGSPLETFLLILVGIGWLSALTVAPIKMLKFVFKSVGMGFRIVRGFIPIYGVADLVAALVGGCFGLFIALVVLVFAPAVFTITKFFKGEKI